MKAIDRLFEYLDYKGIKPTRIEKEIGLSNGYLGVQRKRSADIGSGMLEQIVNYCRDLDVEWVITGRGEMLKGEPAVESKKGGESSSEAISIMLRQVQELSVENHELKREIEALRAEKKIKKSVSYDIAAEREPELSKKHK